MIDERAVIHENAKLGRDVEIGPFSVIGPDVEIGEGCRIASHVVIEGHTRIGRDCRIYQFCSIGAEPQHKAYKGEPTRLEIGERNIFREFVTVHRGTMLDEGVTSIGNDNMLMAYCHVAHDVRLGSNITMANSASLAGHSRVGDYVIMGGFALVKQFCRIGAHSYLGFGCGLSKDVPPFVMAAEQPAQPHGINSEGMRRRGFSNEDIQSVKEAYRLLYRSNLRVVEALDKMSELSARNEAVRCFRDFVAESEHGIIR